MDNAVRKHNTTVLSLFQNPRLKKNMTMFEVQHLE